jgi:D-glycero-D-manno-heptose 1,7-bisphosphate phosphatase
MPGRSAVFLDRDGVIVEEVGYLATPEELKIIPGAVGAITELNRAGVPVVVVTNQAGVARGYFPESRVREIHADMDELLAAGGAVIDAYYYCPHHPTEGERPYRQECACRKPKPGMLLRAGGELQLDLARSFMVGDKLSDLEAGAAAGCRTVLVRTGYGARFETSLDREALRVLGVVDDLRAALELLKPALREVRSASCD